ncbi:MAG: glutamate 5-kinase [Oscillospiraceae bacterium]
MGGKKTLVVKVGTSSLTEKSGRLDTARLRALTAQLACLHGAGHQVILVTSGAIAAGYASLGWHERPTTVPAKQAAAAVGQVLLMEEYSRALAEQGIVAAQLLLTRDDFRDRRRYTNAWSALEVLLSRGAVPIINENDTVSIAELKLGDNDTLSAQVAAMVHADLLLLLTDTDGLYTADPKTDPKAEHIDKVERITPELEAIAGGAGSANGTGGMATKVKGAKLATAAGVAVVICSSGEENVLARAVEGEARGTYFAPGVGMKTRRQWMAFYAVSSGRIYVDSGAEEALCSGGKSLLPAGVTAAEGDFDHGDLVEVRSREGERLLGRGLASCSASELREILGLPTAEAEKLFPGRRAEVIHRDDWVDIKEDCL